MRTTQTGIPIKHCEQCNHTHPITRKHCPDCGLAHLFPVSCTARKPKWSRSCRFTVEGMI